MATTADHRSTRTSPAKRQAYNQRRWALEKDSVPPDGRVPFVCECVDEACMSPLELTLEEYEAAHMCPDWTAVLPDHLIDDGIHAHVLAKHPHFWVVECRTATRGEGEMATAGSGI